MTTIGTSDSAPKSETRELTAEIAAHLEHTTFDDLDAETIEITKLSILDTVGVMLAASGLAPGVDQYVSLATELGGPAESTVLGYGHRVSAPMAAWANGAMVHCLDFDDLVRDVGYHPSSPTVPSALAMGERLGCVSGRDLILAVALGNDLGVRLSASIGEWGGWFTTPVFGCLTSAAAAAQVLSLDQQGTHDALGLAFTQAAGTLEMRWSTNSNIASYYASTPNKAGVMSALLAARGIRGIDKVFEGRAGLYNVYFGGAYEREAVTEGLGVRFRGAEASFKAWPACGGAHPAIDAALHLFGAGGLRAEEVQAVTVATTGGTFTLCEPIEERRAPSTPMDAKFSIPYNIAVAAVRGNVTLEDFRPERLRDPEILAFAQRITAVDDPSLMIRPAALPARIEVTTADGRRFEHRCDQPYGTWPHSRLTPDDVLQKFRDCASYARNPVDGEAIERFADGILQLDSVQDIGSLTGLLTNR